MKVLCVTAHCDDEILWMFPVFQAPEQYELALLPLCRNAHKGDGPMQAVREVCNVNAITLFEPPLEHNQFYRLPTRYDPWTLRQAVNLIEAAIQKALDVFQSDALFTHNPWGEYGHGDHRLAFTIASHFDVPLLLTDICLANHCHPSTKEVPMFYRQVFMSGRATQHCQLDPLWYERMKGIYEQHDAWTWGGHEPVWQANMYRFGGNAT